jgi:hypothetical protein
MRLQILAITLTLLLFSCKKDNDVSPTLHDGKSTVIEDLAGDTGASMSEGTDGKEKRPFYVFLFNLNNKNQIWVRNASDSAQWLKSSGWDLAFSDIYNSTVHVNNGEDPLNPAYGGEGRSLVVMIDRPYDQVTEAPSDAVFISSAIRNIGWETSATPSGWFAYNTSTHLVQPVKNRTYVIRLNDGKYAKLELVNVYKGNPPVVTDLNWPAPYFTFRYYIQQDGSRDLRTR